MVPPVIALDAAVPPAPVARATLRVLVVDDHAAVREGLARLIAHSPQGPHQVRTAATSADALAASRAFAPDVIVLDVDLAGEDGLALIPHFDAPSRVIVLTSHGDADTRARALALGAVAFVEKHEPASVLLARLAA